MQARSVCNTTQKHRPHQGFCCKTLPASGLGLPQPWHRGHHTQPAHKRDLSLQASQQTASLDDGEGSSSGNGSAHGSSAKLTRRPNPQPGRSGRLSTSRYSLTDELEQLAQRPGRQTPDLTLHQQRQGSQTPPRAPPSPTPPQPGLDLVHLAGSQQGSLDVLQSPDRQEVFRDPSRQEEECWQSLKLFARHAIDLDCSQPPPMSAFSGKQNRGIVDMLADLWGRTSYLYFNWRQDTWSDLLLFSFLTINLVAVAALVKDTLLKSMHDAVPGVPIPERGQDLWADFYSIGMLMFGENFPGLREAPLEQVFGLVTATAGLASFALILALIEQAVLEVLEGQVKRGAKIYEQGHFVVLTWGESQRDLEAVERILSQVAQAFRHDGGKVIVVLSQREKLAMEAIYKRAIPPEERHGTQFVFRQGSPLEILDLKDVSVSSAAAVIVVSDNSRSPEDADAQALRTSVILDELDFPGFEQPDSRTGCIVVEMRTPAAIPLLQYSCSDRIVVAPTSLLNARRVARMVTNPISATMSRTLWNFSSHAMMYVECFPQLQGTAFGDLPYFFPDGTPMGLLNTRSGECLYNPASDQVVDADDLIVIARPSGKGKSGFHPLPEPTAPDLGDWDPQNWFRHSYDEQLRAQSSGEDSSLDEDDAPAFYDPSFSVWPGEVRREAASRFPTVKPPVERSPIPPLRFGNGHPLPSATPWTYSYMLYMLPRQYTTWSFSERVLLCGWSEATFMTDMLNEMDHGPACLPHGSSVTLFNSRNTEDIKRFMRRHVNSRNLTIRHVAGDPRCRADLDSLLQLSAFTSAVVLCDVSWMDPNQYDGLEEIDRKSDVRLLDSLVLGVQLNIRKLLQEEGCADINIITERLTVGGQPTRFEDQGRLPMGISVNSTAYSAKLMTAMACDPKLLACALFGDGDTTHTYVQDSAALAAEGECLSWWQLVGRARTVGQVLLGYYNIPTGMGTPVDIIINPVGDAMRSEPRVWNTGDQRTKLIIVGPPLPSLSQRITEITGRELPAATLAPASAIPAVGSVTHQQAANTMVG